MLPPCLIYQRMSRLPLPSRFISLVALIFGWVAFLPAQQSTITVSPDAAQQSTDSSIPVLKVAVRRVVVDVVVTDSSGKPVKGLGQDGFRGFEDAKEQQGRC